MSVSIADNGTQIVGTTKKCVTNSVVGCYAFCAFYTLLLWDMVLTGCSTIKDALPIGVVLTLPAVGISVIGEW